MKKLLFFLLLLAAAAQAQLFEPAFKSGKTDGGDATLVRPSDWNTNRLPNVDSTFFISDEFCSGFGSTGSISALGWSTSNTGTGSGIAGVDGAAVNHPCVQRDSAGAVNPSRQILWLGGSSGVSATETISPASNFTMVWIIKQNTDNTSTVLRLGLTLDPASHTAAAPTSDGIYFERLAAGTTWHGLTRAASTSTATANMDATGTANWVRLTIRRVNGTTIGFQINNGTEVTATATIPTVFLNPFALIDNNASVNGQGMWVDYFGLWITDLNR